MASFGAEILMLERHPVMAILLLDALEHRAEKDKQHMQMNVLNVDAFSYLSKLSKEDYPDIIYIDPMHPEMQVLQQMIGADDDALQLIHLAITRVKQRVVVKWPQKSKSLLAPSSSIEGKTVRFDIYQANRV